MTKIQKRLSMIALLLANFIGGLDTTMLNTALPQIIKDLKVKGSSSTLKQGTRVKNIRLVDGDHNIDCKIDGFGAMKLKSEFVKKI